MERKADDWPRYCQSQGIGAGDTDRKCFHTLKGILCNRSENAERKERALHCLQWFVHRGGVSDLALKAAFFLDDYLAVPPPTAEDNPFRQLVRLDDPAWLKKIQQLDPNLEPRLARQLTQHLSRIIVNRLDTAGHDRGSLLSKVAPLIKQVLDKFEQPGVMGVAERYRMEAWLQEHQRAQMRLQGMVIAQDLQAAEKERNWERVAFLLSNLPQGLDSEIDSLRDRVSRQLDVYHVWAVQFENVMRICERYRPAAGHLFPWPLQVNASRIQEVDKGLRLWGDEKTGAAWQACLDRLVDGAADYLHGGDHPWHEAYTWLEEGEQLWSKATGTRPAVERWHQARQELDQEMGQAFAAWLQDFLARDFFNKDPQDALVEDGRFAYLPAATRQRWEALLVEMRRLEEMQRRIGRLERAEELSQSQEVARLVEELGGRRGDEVMAPVWQGLHRRAVELQRMVQLGREATDLAEAGEWSSAILRLSHCECPWARRLQAQWEFRQEEERLLRCLEEGDVEEVLERGAALSSPRVAELLQQVQDGRKRLEELRLLAREALTLPSVSERVGALAAIVATTPTQSLRLSLRDRHSWLQLVQRIQGTLEELTISELKVLRVACRPYPLLPLREVDGLRLRLENLLNGMELHGLDASLVSLVAEQLAQVDGILAVHHACHQQDWSHCNTLLSSQEWQRGNGRQEVRVSLLALIEDCQLARDKASPERWLAFFRTHAATLFQAGMENSAKSCRRYLQLLQKSSLDRAALATHGTILEKWFPNERFLLSLTRFAQDPNRHGPPSLGETFPKDGIPLLESLLREMVEQCLVTALLLAWWEALSQEERRLVWRNPPSLPEAMEDQYRRRLATIAERIEDPAVDLTRLNDEWSRLQEQCRLPTLSRVKVPPHLARLEELLILEAKLEDLARRDPTALDSRPICQRVLDELDRVGGGLGKRGAMWREQLEQFLHIAEKRRALEKAWKLLQQSKRIQEKAIFSYYATPDQWAGIILPYGNWLENLRNMQQDLASLQMRSGVESLCTWLAATLQDEEEHVLWEKHGLPPPATLDDFLAGWQATYDQMQSFARFHQEWNLRGVAYFTQGSDPLFEKELIAFFSRMREIEPLSSPVRIVRDTLTDPGLTSQGARYHQWLSQNP